MKDYIYFDYGGSHTSVIAAGIHAGLLDPQVVPDRAKLERFPYFDKTTPQDFGRIKYIGTDASGHNVYSLGSKNSEAGPLLQGMAELHGAADQFELIDTMPYVDTWLRTGGWLSRSVGWETLGRPLVIKGIRKEYKDIAAMVDAIRVKAKGEPS
jgi:hypothetical protein